MPTPRHRRPAPPPYRTGDLIELTAAYEVLHQLLWAQHDEAKQRREAGKKGQKRGRRATLGPQRPDALITIAALREAQFLLESILYAEVAEAFRDDLLHREVADELGVRRQAVGQRFQGTKPLEVRRAMRLRDQITAIVDANRGSSWRP